MTKNAQNTETPVKSEETLTIGAMTAEQLAQAQAELQALSESLEDKEKALLEKEEELTAKEAELEEKSNALTKALEEGMEEGEVSLEQFLRENAHPDGIQFSEYVLKVTNGPESHLEGFIRPNPYGGQTKSVKITATMVKVS